MSQLFGNIELLYEFHVPICQPYHNTQYGYHNTQYGYHNTQYGYQDTQYGYRDTQTPVVIASPTIL